MSSANTKKIGDRPVAVAFCLLFSIIVVVLLYNAHQESPSKNLKIQNVTAVKPSDLTNECKERFGEYAYYYYSEDEVRHVAIHCRERIPREDLPMICDNCEATK